MNEKLSPQRIQQYLTYDSLDLMQATCVLFGYAPMDKQRFNDDFGYLTPIQKQFYDMACASINAGAIEPIRSHINSWTEFAEVAVQMTYVKENHCQRFSAKPLTWIKWAVSKNFQIHRIFQNARQEPLQTLAPAQSQQKTASAPRNRRPENETHDKITAKAVMKTIHDMIPDLPIAWLITLDPVTEYLTRKYTPETLRDWATEIGITTKPGRLTEEDEEKLKKSLPKQWNIC